MAHEELEIEISPDGKVTVRTKGIKGPRCVDVAEAIVKVQRALRTDPARATEAGKKRFPPAAAEIIADLVERDRVFYDPVITEADIKATSDFSRSLGLLSEPVPYDQVVATRFRPLWTPQ